MIEFSIIITSLLLISSFLLYKNEEKIKLLNNEIIKQLNQLSEEKNKSREILFWVINKPNEKDYITLEKSSEALSLFTKIIHYEIAKTTDIARSSLENEVLQRSVWALNKLHELNLLIEKIKNYSKIDKDDEE